MAALDTLNAVAAHPGATAQELADYLGQGHGTVTGQLLRLLHGRAVVRQAYSTGPGPGRRWAYRYWLTRPGLDRITYLGERAEWLDGAPEDVPDPPLALGRVELAIWRLGWKAGYEARAEEEAEEEDGDGW